MTRVVAVVGTNASGKSTLALSLAERLGAEIVAADSRQVYRFVRLSSGLGTEEDLRRVPHHCIEFADPGVQVSLSDYLSAANRAVDDILSRGRIPLVVGGSPLYSSALLDGYQLPDVAPDPEWRLEAARYSAAELAGKLASYSQLWSESVGPTNHRRLVRAIELARAGITYADAHRSDAPHRFLELGLTHPPDQLRERISNRLDRRLRDGMVEEIAVLVDKGVDEGFLLNLGLEFRHTVQYLNGSLSGFDSYRDSLERAIWRFSRRQLSWYRRRETIQWLNPSISPEALAGRVRTYLSSTD